MVTYYKLIELLHAGMKLESSAAQEEQIKRIAATYGTTTNVLLSGGQASEERIKSDTARAKVLHFSTPAI